MMERFKQPNETDFQTKLKAAVESVPEDQQHRIARFGRELFGAAYRSYSREEFDLHRKRIHFQNRVLVQSDNPAVVRARAELLQEAQKRQPRI